MIVLNSLAEPAFLCTSRQPTCSLKISYGKIKAPTQQQLIQAARSSDVCNSIRLQHGAGKPAKKNNNTFPARVFFQDAQDSVERNDLCPEPESRCRATSTIRLSQIQKPLGAHGDDMPENTARHRTPTLVVRIIMAN